MTAPLRVLLIEDHPIVRSGCRRLLESRGGVTVFEAETGEAGLLAAAAHAPDLVVLDLNLPDLGGLKVLAGLLAARPDLKVLIFSMYEDPAFVVRALEAGALGYVTKSDDPDRFLEAIDAVGAGELYLGHAIARKVALLKLGVSRDPLSTLSVREREVLALLGQGSSLAEIAVAVKVSYRTTANLVAVMKTKLNIPTTAALIRLAVEHSQPGR